MTYLVPQRRRMVKRPARGLAGFVDDVVNTFASSQLGIKIPSDELKCLNEANTSSAVTAIDAKVDDLAKNWNPTGFYTPADIQTVYKSTIDAVTQARGALLSSILSTSDAAQQVKQAGDYLDRSTTRGNAYMTAANQAKAAGTAVNAPGFKQWVLETLVNVGQAYTTVAVLQCQSSWLDTAAAIIDSVVGVAKRIVGIVLKAGEVALNVVDDVLDLYSIIKWGALGLGVFLVVREVRKRA